MVDILDIGAFEESQWGFNGFFSKQNGGGFFEDSIAQTVSNAFYGQLGYDVNKELNISPCAII